MGNWQCSGCSALYNETENNNVPFADTPLTWVCPNCGGSRSQFRDAEKKRHAAASGIVPPNRNRPRSEFQERPSQPSKRQRLPAEGRLLKNCERNMSTVKFADAVGEGAAGENETLGDIPSFLEGGGQAGFYKRFPNTPSERHCFLGHGREEAAKAIIEASAQTKASWQTVDRTNEGQKVFVKQTEAKDDKDIKRELAVCSKLVKHREWVRESSGDDATVPFGHLSLPLAACAYDQGGFLIASPLLFDTAGNQAGDLMSALLASQNREEWPEIAAARTHEWKLRALFKPLFKAVAQMQILNIAHRDIK